jgi:CBS domain-containing protein
MLPVVYGSKLEGIIRREHVLTLTSTRSDATVNNIMVGAPLTFKLNEDALRAFEVMIEFDEWYVPVVDEAKNRYAGVLALDSLLRHFIDKDHPAHSIPVDDVMSTEVEYVYPDDYIYRVWRKMLKYKFTGFPVVKGRKKTVIGFITQHDLLKKGYSRIELESESGPRKGPKIREAMTTPAITIKIGTKLIEAATILIKKNIGRLPVVDDKGTLIGIVDRSDVSKPYLKMR